MTGVLLPRRTTAAGGAALTVAAAIALLPASDLVVEPLPGLQVPLYGDGFAAAGAVLLAAGALVLAIGVRGESGIAGRSRSDAACLAVGGAVPLLLLLLVPLPMMPLLGWTSQAVLVGGGIAAVVGAVAVARSRLLAGAARWCLLPAAVLQLLLTLPALAALPLPVFSVLAGAEGLHAVLLLAAGAVLLLAGRTGELRVRARALRERW